MTFDLVLLVIVFVLFAIILAVMRELVLVRDELSTLAGVVMHPPLPDFLGSPPPGELARLLTLDDTGVGMEGPAVRVVLFVSSNCPGCHALLHQLEAIADQQDGHRPDPAAILCVAQGQAIFREASRVLENVVVDRTNEIFADWGVRVTPSAFTIVDGIVRDVKIGGDVEWIRTALQSQARTRQV
jgi:thiol-disulfide isomerase/thioredoxin